MLTSIHIEIKLGEGEVCWRAAEALGSLQFTAIDKVNAQP